MEFKLSNTFFRTRQVFLNIGDGPFVIFVDSELKQFARVGKPAGQLIEIDDHFFKQGTFLPKGLRPLGIVPDVRFLQFALNFGQPLRLSLVVKDTPSTHWCVRRDHLSAA